MNEEKLLTVREVSTMLGLSEKEILDLAENGSIPAYKLGGLYLRFKREQVEEFWKKTRKDFRKPANDSWIDRIADFYSFNDFYIFSTIIIVLMLLIIFS